MSRNAYSLGKESLVDHNLQLFLMSNSQLLVPLFSVGETLHFLLLNEFLGLNRKYSASLHLSMEGQESLYRKQLLYGGTETFSWPRPHPL